MKKHLLLLAGISLLVISLFAFSSCGLADEGVVEYHHIFPREFANDFAAKGIKVDDFTIALTKKDHRGAGEGIQYNPTNWNSEWRNFLKANPNCSATQCYKKAQRMAYDAGMQGRFDFYNYQTKQLSNGNVAGNNALVATSTKGIWGFFGRFGNFLIQLLGGFKFGACFLAFIAAIGSTFLGWFGIKVEHPIAVAIGFIVLILGIILTIGVVYCIIIFVKWIIAVLIPALLGLLGLGSAAS